MNILKNNLGLLIRIGMVAFFIPAGFEIAVESQPFLIIVAPLVFIGGILLCPLTLWINKKTEPTRNWSRPTWRTNPFSGPPQFYHAAAWAFIGAGLVATLRAMHSGHILTIGLLPLCFGLGTYLGIRLFFTFPGQKQNQTTPKQP